MIPAQSCSSRGFTERDDGDALTSFTVRLAVLHVEGVASDWLLAGHACKTGHVPSVLQGVGDLLRSTGEKRARERERKSVKFAVETNLISFRASRTLNLFSPGHP